MSSRSNMNNKENIKQRRRRAAWLKRKKRMNQVPNHVCKDDGSKYGFKFSGPKKESKNV